MPSKLARTIHKSTCYAGKLKTHIIVQLHGHIGTAAAIAEIECGGDLPFLAVKTDRNLKIGVERFLALGSDEIVCVLAWGSVWRGVGVEEGKRRHDKMGGWYQWYRMVRTYHKKLLCSVVCGKQ